ncbi:globin domain-containing protein [Rhodomicrobium lacus]|uniref:globin domain-containing protein n=1 Tax=Rhodomicrobium lacus TaxID=2498452 RepID=UPI000F8D977B|nr:globin domain-containing protein [Rhodomicrobium lacus]WKW50492.1 globin domain-containing protein [Rhodomicrobium lacus]
MKSREPYVEFSLIGPNQLAALRDFFSNVEGDLPEIVARMYDRFFEAVPEAASLFKGDFAAQQLQFASMLRSTIALTRSSQLWPVDPEAGRASLPEIEYLGLRHACAGVQPEHFAAMKWALARTLAEMYPTDFDRDIEDALGFIFDVVSKATKTGRAPVVRKGK